MGSNRKNRAVPARYSFTELKRDVESMRDGGRSLRWIAVDLSESALTRFGQEVRITHRTVQRILQDKEPMAVNLRLALGLPALTQVPVCERCGVAHIMRRCPRTAGQAKPKRRNWKRVATLVALAWIATSRGD